MSSKTVPMPGIEIVMDDGVDVHDLPAPETMCRAIWQTLQCAGFADARDVQLCVRLTDDEQIRALNRQWRAQDHATDVLSFPLQHGPDFTLQEYLGDIALAVPYVRREVERLSLPFAAHVQHLLVHGVLHLIGFDHAEAEERQRMQAMERRIMQALALHDPFPFWQQQEKPSCN